MRAESRSPANRVCDLTGHRFGGNICRVGRSKSLNRHQDAERARSGLRYKLERVSLAARAEAGALPYRKIRRDIPEGVQTK